MSENREYKINIDPRILELLGPNLYTNIYYVLAELIANAYDANADNVYIIQKKDCIIVEDDGEGMSYKDGDIEKYLNVAVETRTTRSEIFTAGHKRRKIGRKGVGKVAALSVSENVLINTIKNGEKSGFILSRHVGQDRLLTPISEGRIKFEIIREHGTSIIMSKPQYGLHKTTRAIKKNLLKIFPIVNKEFKIHITIGQEKIIIDSFDQEIVQELGALFIIGNEFKYLSEFFDPGLGDKVEVDSGLYKYIPEVSEKLTLLNKARKNKSYNIKLKGWLGAYRSTRGRKLDSSDFPDNFISLLSLGKLGEYNILPLVGKNRLVEVYIVGQLHIDLFEETELPDMALSNRQGYKTDDPRYQFVIKKVRDELLPFIITMRTKYSDHLNREMKLKKLQKQIEAERELRKKVEDYKATASTKAARKIARGLALDKSDEIENIITRELNNSITLIGIKRKVDDQKKKILICHTEKDKLLADTVYKMLSFNQIPDDALIYTSCENPDARVPDGYSVFDYLHDFFVESYSEEKIMVLYITSEIMSKSWGAVTEVGAGWITKMDHKIFNVDGHRPMKPLDIDAEWQTSIIDGDKLKMKKVEFSKFVIKIINVCNKLGYKPQSVDANNKELNRYVTVIS